MMNEAEEKRRQKAKNLRYRKAIVKDLNYDVILEELYDMMEACDDVRYYFEDDDDTLINALDGDEDDAYEFKMMFADLSAECEQMHSDLRSEYVPTCFDDFFVAVSDNDPLQGWDSWEGDYIGLYGGYEENLAREEAKKRMQRMTKEQLLDAAQACFSVFRAYIGLRHRFDCLKAAIDILRDENTGHLKLVKQINETYDRANADDFYGRNESTRELDKLIECMPDVAWIQ